MTTTTAARGNGWGSALGNAVHAVLMSRCILYLQV